MNPDTQASQAEPGRAAWTAVAVLWLIAFVYYFDRLFLTSMRDAIRADIGISDAQFGLLTSVFLWVYAVLSPFGGFVADRFGRKPIICASLLLWSVAIWLTGHSSSFHELLLSRVMMGISEASYLPAALALVNNQHRGSTRSLATGLHNSGLYAGAALGGIGGWFAEFAGWRLGFSALGILGLAYSVVVFAFLKDKAPDGSGPGHPPAAAKPGWDALGLLRNPRYCVLAAIFSMMGLANWLSYVWLPTFLRQTFTLSHGVAGLSATGYLQVSGICGILAGGIWADRWSRSEPRARARVAAVGMLLGLPGLFLAGASSFFSGAILGLLLFGIGRGLFDANCMPILRQIIPERLSATAYGFMNLCSCMVGGLVAYGSGMLLDAGLSLSIAFKGAAVGMGLAALALAALIPRRGIVPPGGPAR